MNIALLCIGLLGFLCIATGFNVSMARAKTQTVYGGDADPESPLYKAMRAQGNTVEYAPILALMMYVLSHGVLSGWIVWTMILATFFRYLLVAGLLLPKTMAKPNPLRFVGALGTYISGLMLAVAVLLQALAL